MAPVRINVEVGVHTESRPVYPGRALIVFDDGRIADLSIDQASATVSAAEAAVATEAARAELMRAQALKAMAEARAIAQGGPDLGLDGSAVGAAEKEIAEAMKQARPGVPEFPRPAPPAFPLDAEQIVNLLAETIRVVLDEIVRPPVTRFGRDVSIGERLMVAAGLSDGDHGSRARDAGGAA